HPLDAAPPVRAFFRGWTPQPYVAEPHRARVTLWSPAWAQHVSRALRSEPTDVVVADFELLGALAAAEAAGVPSAALVHNVPWRPTRGVPPRGPGSLPARSPPGHARDTIGNTIITRIQGRDGLPAHNRARARLGLRPLRFPFEQYDRAARVLVLT